MNFQQPLEAANELQFVCIDHAGEHRTVIRAEPGYEQKQEKFVCAHESIVLINDFYMSR